MTLCDGESLPVSSLTFDIANSKTPLTYDPRLSLEKQKELQLNSASEGPAADSGLKAVSIHK